MIPNNHNFTHKNQNVYNNVINFNSFNLIHSFELLLSLKNTLCIFIVYIRSKNEIKKP